MPNELDLKGWIIVTTFPETHLIVKIIVAVLNLIFPGNFKELL